MHKYSRSAQISTPNSPVASLDLHGYRKEAAIRAVTDFVERISSKPTRDPSVWVSIITGSGQHSTDGPVLRTAVEKLLIKRNMKYAMNSDKGGFLVDALSGKVLYADGQPSDTKVILRSRGRDDVHLIGRVPPPGRKNRCSSEPPRESHHTVINPYDHPLPCHVAEDDARLERAKEMSRKERMAQASFETHEQKALSRALSESMLEEASLQQCQQNEEDSLRRALEMSEKDPSPQHVAIEQEDDEFLKRALAESELVFHRTCSDDELEAVLRLSERQFCVSESDREELLLHQSGVDHYSMNSDLETILRQSVEEFATIQPDIDEETLIKQALQLSLQDLAKKGDPNLHGIVDEFTSGTKLRMV